MILGIFAYKNRLNMEELLLKFIEEYFGLAFAIGVVIVSAILVGIIGFTIWCIKVISKNRELEAKINGLPCSDHKESISKHSSQYETILASLNRMTGQVDMIAKMVGQAPKHITEDASIFSEKYSPRKLNGNGLKLYEQAHGEDFLNANAQFLLSEIENTHPKTALDVENLSLAVLYANSNKDIFNSLKNWIYIAPAIEIQNKDGVSTMRDISLDDVLYVLSIPLRDRYLSIHPEINISDD